jgi:hypothetical protein
MTFNGSEDNPGVENIDVVGALVGGRPKNVVVNGAELGAVRPAPVIGTRFWEVQLGAPVKVEGPAPSFW